MSCCGELSSESDHASKRRQDHCCCRETGQRVTLSTKNFHAVAIATASLFRRAVSRKPLRHKGRSAMRCPNDNGINAVCDSAVLPSLASLTGWHPSARAQQCSAIALRKGSVFDCLKGLVSDGRNQNARLHRHPRRTPYRAGIVLQLRNSSERAIHMMSLCLGYTEAEFAWSSNEGFRGHCRTQAHCRALSMSAAEELALGHAV